MICKRADKGGTKKKGEIMAIRAEIRDIETQSAEFNNESDEMRDLITRCTNLVNGLDEFWEGNAKDAFVEQWNDLTPGLNDTAQLLEDIGSQLKSVAQVMEETDEQLAQGMGIK